MGPLATTGGRVAPLCVPTRLYPVAPNMGEPGSRGMTPGPPVLALGKMGRSGKRSTNKELLLSVLKIVIFVLIGVVFYSKYTHINDVSFAEGNDSWDWDFTDCWYFTAVTMTTVGYGDMPQLSQGMRAFTMLFGFVGV